MSAFTPRQQARLQYMFDDHDRAREELREAERVQRVSEAADRIAV